MTSPPYADMRDYTKISPDEYVGWFLPIGKKIHRVLKNNGVFVLNIRNHIVNKSRHPYVYELIYKLCDDFDLIEDMIWDKVKVFLGDAIVGVTTSATLISSLLLSNRVKYI